MENNSLIYKDNRIIEASYRLSLVQQRLVLLAISQINSIEILNNNKIFIITASEYSSVFGIGKDAAFREMKKAIDELYKASVKVIVEEGTVYDFRWISSKTSVTSNQSVQIRFTADIAPFLSNLKGSFTKYKFLNITGMSSVFSIRIYEWMMQWKIKKSVTVSIEQLKDRLQIIDKYPAFANLKQKVIDVAIAEINELTDINISYELIKSGKKVVSVKFTFEFKEGKNADVEIKQSIKDVFNDIKKGLK